MCCYSISFVHDWSTESRYDKSFISRNSTALLRTVFLFDAAHFTLPEGVGADNASTWLEMLKS